MKWQKVRLDSVCESISDGDHLAPPKSDSGVPFITISNIDSNNNIDFTRCMYVPRSYYENVDSKRKPQRGDVLYSVVGSFGKPVLMRENAEFVFQRHIAILRPKSDVLSSRFLYATMLSPAFYALADAAAVGTAQRTVSLSSLRGMEISLPPLPIQQKIADILGAYDDLIENNRRRIELLEKMARELYRERFVRRAVRVKEFPLGEIAEFVRGKVIVKTATIPGDVPVVAGGLEPAYYHNDSNTKAPVVTVSGSGANAGFARMYFEKVWASDCSWVDAAGTKYIRFVYCFLKDNDAVLRNAQKGAVQPHVHAKDVNALTVAAEKTVISGFEESVIPIFDELANLEQQTRSLVKQRDRLLPRLMSGKIELDKLVKEAE